MNSKVVNGDGLTVGQNLRMLRESLGLTMRDIETASERIARKRNNEEYFIPISRLSDFETKGMVPSIYRIYSLSVIYRRDMREVLSWYGVNLDISISELEVSAPPKSHLSGALANTQKIQMPVRLDPGFDSRRTLNFGRMIEQWGTVPLMYLEQLSNQVQYTYGYVGTDDLTMYPILPPGSFIQVDESLNQVAAGGWRSEYERPIYFVETRDGYRCCWCTMGREEMILQSHPLSPVPAKVVRASSTEVIGQVVGAAMRLGEWRSVPGSAQDLKEPVALN
jgi:transcriptional regulator with XRE-family HTH domain